MFRGRQPDKDILYGFLAANVEDFGMFITDLQGCITAWNAGAERILGWSEEEVLGKHAELTFTHEDRVAGVPEAEITRAMQVGCADDMRWHVKKDGSRFYADGVMTALKDDAGVLFGYGKVLRDATKRACNEHALREALERERTIARVLQLPLTRIPEPDAFPGITVAARYEPGLNEADASGDFFDVFDLPNGHVCLMVGDVSGKGLQAAARAILIKEVLRAFARENPHSPAYVVARVNEYIYASKQSDPERHSGERFVTLVLATLNPETGEAVVVSAGAEPALVIRTSGVVESTLPHLDMSGFPLGMSPQSMYHTMPLHIAAGDTLLLNTDGITEARPFDGHLLGVERLKALAGAANSAHSCLPQIADAILEGAREFGGGHFRDDVCLLMARRR